MSYVYPDAVARLGSSYTGLSGTVGYRLIASDGTVTVPFTTTNVVETTIHGNYRVFTPAAGGNPAFEGMTIPSGFSGRIVWGISGTDLSEEWIWPAKYEFTLLLGVDTPGTETLLQRITGPVFLQETWPSHLKNNLFSADGVLAAAAFQNMPAQQGGTGLPSGIQVARGTITAANSPSLFTALMSSNANGNPKSYPGKWVIFQTGATDNQERGMVSSVVITGPPGAYLVTFNMSNLARPSIQNTPSIGDTIAVF